MSLEPPLNIMATKPPNCDYEQRAFIKIRSLLGDTNTQIQIDLRKVYGDDTLSDSTIRRWSLLFREGRQYVDDDPRSGRPTTATTQTNIEKIKEIINEDPHITLSSIALRVDISKGKVHEIIHNHLGMRKPCARWIPHNLTASQKRTRVEIAKKHLQTYKNCRPDRLYNICMGDETWIYFCEPQRKEANKMWVEIGGTPQ